MHPGVIMCRCFSKDRSNVTISGKIEGLAVPVLGIVSGTLSTIILCVAVFCGAALCFFGHQLFRFAAVLAGLVLGAALAAYVAWHETATPDTLAMVTTFKDVVFAVLHPRNPVVIIVCAVVGGVAAGVLFGFLQPVAVFALGSLLGGGIANYTMAGSPANAYWTVLAVVGLISGILALLFRNVTIVVSTAISGAIALVFGLYALMANHSCEELLEQSRGLGSGAYVALGCAIILAAVGGYVQFTMIPEAKPKSGDKKDAEDNRKKK